MCYLVLTWVAPQAYGPVSAFAVCFRAQHFLLEIGKQSARYKRLVGAGWHVS